MRTPLPLHAPPPTSPDEGFDAHVAALRSTLATLPGLVVAFSGGVDSSVLLAEAHAVLGDRAVAATAVSPSLAPSEREVARAVAAAIGADHVEVETFEGRRPAYVANGRDRCFHCKSELFDRLAALVERYGRVAVGTIVDDLGQHRPGHLAAAQRGVLTPLADAGMTKADVRELAARHDLPTADAPAQACLASRVAYGLPVTPDRLGRIAAAEAWLGARGFRTRRVRDHGDRASVEVAAAEVPRLERLGAELAAHLGSLGWAHVDVDPRGYRTGSLDEVAG